MMNEKIDHDLSLDERRMFEALEYALFDTARVSPNPKVGCVIYAKDDSLISLGVTSPPGGPHAERVALNLAAQEGRSVEGATVYVTLEPCAHHGRTGPCTSALIEAKVGRVCIGVLDPNPLVQGRGVKALRAAGITVEQGVLESECSAHHSPFFKWIQHGLPWVSLKGAMTLDGCLATASGHSQWITGQEARTHVHRLRAKVDAIMVGGETIRRDRPALTVRHCEGQDPRPIGISRRLLVPSEVSMLRPGAILIHGEDAPQERKERLIDLGVSLIEVPYLAASNEQRLDLSYALRALGEAEITHLCVEGGGMLHGELITRGLIDDLHLYLAPKLIGRGKPLFSFSSVGLVDDAHQLRITKTERLGEDIYLYGRFI